MKHSTNTFTLRQKSNSGSLWMFPSCVSSQGLCRWGWRPGWPRDAWVLRAIVPLSRPPGPSRCCGTGSCINESRPRAAPVVFTTVTWVRYSPAWWRALSRLSSSREEHGECGLLMGWGRLQSLQHVTGCQMKAVSPHFFSFFNSTVSECTCMHFIFYLWFCTLPWSSAVLKAFLILYLHPFFLICWNEIKQHNASSTLM